jgi:beta-phosphoglucomutase-like phosphatase (HAD superfamily)
MMKMEGLLFDCDGVLAETERDGHRVAYNQAMSALGIDAQWSPEEYGELVLVSGGKERLKYYFGKYPERFPPGDFNGELIQQIYIKKTGIFKELAGAGNMPPRSGIARVIREAHELDIKLFVCSTSHRESVETLLRRNYGEECCSWFTELFCGDIVARKKPAPDIYLLARDSYKLDPSLCFVVEDSRNGLLAARGAGMHCLITQSCYTREENFDEADIVAASLGDPGGEEGRIVRSSRTIPQRGYITVADLVSFL